MNSCPDIINVAGTPSWTPRLAVSTGQFDQGVPEQDLPLIYAGGFELSRNPHIALLSLAGRVRYA